MRKLLSIVTILASASVAEAQIGQVTGTVQDTTRVQTEELELDSASHIGSRLQTDVPTSRIEQMRQRRALREARRARNTVREDVVPETSAVADSQAELTARAADQAEAVISNDNAVSASADRVAATSNSQAGADIADRANAAVSQNVEIAAEPEPVPIRPVVREIRAETEAAIETVQTNVRADLPRADVTVQTPQTVVSTGGSRTIVQRPAYRTETIVVRDRQRVAENTAAPQTAEQTRPAPMAAAMTSASRNSGNGFISMDSVTENAFSLCCALLLILSLVLGARLLTRPRRARR